MSNRRDQLKQAQLADPKTASGAINDTLRDLYDRIEALERVRFVDLQAQAAGAVLPAFVVAAPPWPVRGVYLARLFNVTDNAIEAPVGFFAWGPSTAGVSTLPLAVAGTSSRYALTLEIRG